MSEPTAAVSNIPEYSVSEISSAVKRTLEGAFGRVRIRGELTEVKAYPSGHIYLSLKDEGGKLAAIIWKGSVSRLGLKPENGVEVVATGRITAYGERSSYQLIIERLEYAGIGALLARIEALRVRLTAEGLFDAARKRPLPHLPTIIGVITSERGAVIQDILTTIARRFPRHVMLWPVPVQGEAAAARIAAAIAGFALVVPRPDLLIVARGGGSLEDLMAFNDEAVVRAAAASVIPLISAVGHETDTTLIDFASDRRAPTPTAAAELAVPSRTQLATQLAQAAAHLATAAGRTLDQARNRTERAVRALPDLPALVGGARQTLDDRGHRLGLAWPHLLRVRRHALAAALRQLPDLPGLVDAARRSLDDRGHRLLLALPHLLRTRRHALGVAERRLGDPRAALAQARGQLDGLAARLPLALPRALGQRRQALALAESTLRSALRHSLARRGGEAARVLPRFRDALVANRLREARLRVESLGQRLESVSHHGVLARGYAVVRDGAGHPVTQAASVKPGAALEIEFADGRLATRAAAEQRQRLLL